MKFRYKRSLKSHKKIHKDDKPSQCNRFGVALQISDNFEEHQPILGSFKLFYCKFCNRTSQRKKFLVEHNRKHLGFKTFKCELCYKNFVLSEYLDKHKVNHNGIKF